MGVKLLNQEIWLAYPNMVKLSKIPLPVKSGLQIGVLLAKLQQPFIAIERERRKLVNQYGIACENPSIKEVPFDNPNAGDFAVKFGELLILEWPDEFEISKAQIPEMMTGNCPHCKNPIDIPFIIEPMVLLPLQEKFIELIK